MYVLHLIGWDNKTCFLIYEVITSPDVEADEDNLVRTCVVKYSLVQEVFGKDRENYVGVKSKMSRRATPGAACAA